MAGLWRKDRKTREGKYPVLLRRDGTVPEREWFVMLDGDPCAIAALRAYADEARNLGLDPEYVSDIFGLAEEWMNRQTMERMERTSGRWVSTRRPDPDAPPHRTDNQDVLTFPDSLAEYRARITGADVTLQRPDDQVGAEVGATPSELGPKATR